MTTCCSWGFRPGLRTFGLDLFTVGRNNDTLDLVQLHVLGDLSETHDQAPLGLGLVGILLVHSLLEADQLLQQKRHALVDFLAEYLVAVPGENQKQSSHSVHLQLMFAMLCVFRTEQAQGD